jgi:hypothetical protein
MAPKTYMTANKPTPDFDDELLSAYVDNELTPSERAAVEERLRTDEGARQTLAELQRAADALKALPARRLGRDLSANIWAAIDAQKNDAQKTVESAVVTLPSRDAAGPSGKGRGLIWAALAIAAALMLMVLRPGAELRDEGSVARTAPQPNAKAPKDPKADPRDLARVESVGVDAGATSAASQEQVRLNAAPQSAAAPLAERGGDDRAAPRPESARSRDNNLADGAMTANDLADNLAAAPRAARGVAGSAPAGVGPTKFAAEAEPEADEAIVADAAKREQLRTIEVVVSGGAEAFEQMLAQHRITMVEAAADEFAPLAAAASGAAVEAKATSAEESDGVQSDRAARGDTPDGDAVQGAAPVAILVEASPAAIAEIIRSLQPQTESRYALRRSAKESAELDAVARAQGPGEILREASAADNRAWRVPFDSYFADSEALVKLAVEEPAAPPAATAAAPAGALGGRGGGGGLGGSAGFGGGGFGGRALGTGAPRQRVLFILRSE